jgi:hypothetical protein
MARNALKGCYKNQHTFSFKYLLDKIIFEYKLILGEVILMIISIYNKIMIKLGFYEKIEIEFVDAA